MEEGEGGMWEACGSFRDLGAEIVQVTSWINNVEFKLIVCNSSFFAKRFVKHVHQGPVSRKSRKLFGPEKSSVKVKKKKNNSEV